MKFHTNNYFVTAVALISSILLYAGDKVDAENYGGSANAQAQVQQSGGSWNAGSSGNVQAGGSANLDTNSGQTSVNIGGGGGSKDGLFSKVKDLLKDGKDKLVGEKEKLQQEISGNGGRENKVEVKADANANVKKEEKKVSVDARASAKEEGSRSSSQSSVSSRSESKSEKEKEREKEKEKQNEKDKNEGAWKTEEIDGKNPIIETAHSVQNTTKAVFDLFTKPVEKTVKEIQDIGDTRSEADREALIEHQKEAASRLVRILNKLKDLAQLPFEIALRPVGRVLGTTKNGKKDPLLRAWDMIHQVVTTPVQVISKPIEDAILGEPSKKQRNEYQVRETKIQARSNVNVGGGGARSNANSYAKVRY